MCIRDRAIGAVPSRKIPEAVERITTNYLNGRKITESFQDYIQRVGKAECKKLLLDLTEVPTYEEDPSYYSDWGDPRVFTTGDMGIGECAGEIVAPIDFQLTACEREVFEAQLHLEAGRINKAASTAFESMINAAAALLRYHKDGFEDDVTNTDKTRSHRIIELFRLEFFETELFFDPFAKGKFASYLFKAQKTVENVKLKEQAHQLIEESSLFIEASHSCYARLADQAATA